MIGSAFGNVLERAAFATRAIRDDRRIDAVLTRLIRSEQAMPSWRVLSMHPSQWSPVGVTVGIIGPPEEPRLVVKLPHSAAGAASLAAEHRNLQSLHADPRLSDIAALIPRAVATIGDPGTATTVQTALPGMSAVDQPVATTDEALAWIRELHRRTLERRLVDDTMLIAWIDRPLETIASVVGGRDADRQRTARLGNGLREQLRGRALATGWIHGDLWAGNELVAPREPQRLTGVIDWDRAAPVEMPWHDVISILLTPDRLADPTSADVPVLAALGRRAWTADEAVILDATRRELDDESPSVEVLVAIWWLRHVAMTLTNDPALGRARGFVGEHVERLLGLQLLSD